MAVSKGAKEVAAQPLAPPALKAQPVVIQPVIVKVPASAYQMPWWGLWLIPLLPLILTMIGWYIVGRQNDRRERRKDLRDSISEIKKRLDSIETRVASYVQIAPKHPTSGILASQIKGDLQVIGEMMKGLGLGGLAFSRWDLLAALRQEATGGDFESGSRKVGDVNRVAMVGLATMDLTTVLDSMYFSAFPIKVAKVSKS